MYKKVNIDLDFESKQYLTSQQLSISWFSFIYTQSDVDVDVDFVTNPNSINESIYSVLASIFFFFIQRENAARIACDTHRIAFYFVFVLDVLFWSREMQEKTCFLFYLKWNGSSLAGLEIYLDILIDSCLSMKISKPWNMKIDDQIPIFSSIHFDIRSPESLWIHPPTRNYF